jgi:hypothetical protein
MLAERFEVGTHTLNQLTTLAAASKTFEMAGSKGWLEDITGERVTMFCCPSGGFDRATKQAVRGAGSRGAGTLRQFS